MRATKATSISSSRCPEPGPKRGKKKRNSKGSSSQIIQQGSARRRSDEKSKPVDAYAYRDGDGDDSPGPPGERASLVCGRIRCERASDADRNRHQDGVDQSSCMDLHCCPKA